MKKGLTRRKYLFLLAKVAGGLVAKGMMVEIEVIAVRP
ncbi:MAG: hypothetical protein ACI88A_002797 [Paraglaciecola sp.]|jgi:hypothetical protein